MVDLEKPTGIVQNSWHKYHCMKNIMSEWLCHRLHTIIRLYVVWVDLGLKYYLSNILMANCGPFSPGKCIRSCVCRRCSHLAASGKKMRRRELSFSYVRSNSVGWLKNSRLYPILLCRNLDKCVCTSVNTARGQGFIRVIDFVFRYYDLFVWHVEKAAFEYFVPLVRPTEVPCLNILDTMFACMLTGHPSATRPRERVSIKWV